MVNDLRFVRKVAADVGRDDMSHFYETRHYVQHGRTSVMKHCIAVAVVSCRIAKKLHINVDANALVRGALLHDYFLYDWHETGHQLHGFRHPYAALRNANRDFRLSETEQNVILRHMFPLTPIPPACREAWVVCLADKYCSTRETMYTVKKHVRNAVRFVFG